MNLGSLFLWIVGRWERVLFYGSLIFLIFLVFTFQQDLEGFSQMAQEDTRFLLNVGPAPVLIDEAWVDLLIRRTNNSAAFVKLPARDLFSVVKEAGFPIAARNEMQGLPRPGANDRFSLVKIYRQAVRLLFKGYLQLPDGTYSLQINWAGQTDFKEAGESIRGYKIERFEKVIGMQVIQRGYSREVDNSYVIIRKDPNGPVTLSKGKLVSEKELFAKLFDAQTNTVVMVHVGSELGDHKVLDITEDEVLLSDTKNKEMRLKRVR